MKSEVWKTLWFSFVKYWFWHQFLGNMEAHWNETVMQAHSLECEEKKVTWVSTSFKETSLEL